MVGHDQSNPFIPYDFEAANKDYVENVFDGSFKIVGARSRCGIITCCDARCIPESFYEMKENDAFVIRNGGGRTASEDVIRTLTLIQILSEIKELKIIHHTDCGSLAFFDEEIREVIKTNDPTVPGGPWKPGALAWAEAMAFQPFTALEGESPRDRVVRSITQDVHYLKSHPLIKASIKITGYLYDLEDGTVTEITGKEEKEAPVKNGYRHETNGTK